MIVSTLQTANYRSVATFQLSQAIQIYHKLLKWMFRHILLIKTWKLHCYKQKINLNPVMALV